MNFHFGSHRFEYARYVQSLLYDYFHKQFRFADSGNGTLRLKIESRAIYHYFEEYLIFDPAVKHFTVKLKSLDLPRPFLRGFLRGYIDTDGSILRDKRCNSLIVMFFTTSEVMAQQIERILGALHIEITTWCLRRTRYKPLYYIRVRVRAVKAFLHLVHPFKMRYLPARAHMRT